MKMYGLVSGIIQNENNEFCLVRQTDSKGEVFWSFPSGVLEESESYIDAFHREIWEETGLKTCQLQGLAYTAQHVNHKKNWQMDILTFYGKSTKNSSLSVKNDPDGEIEEVSFFSLKETIHKLKETSKIVISRPAIYALEHFQTHSPFWLFEETETEIKEKLVCWHT